MVVENPARMMSLAATIQTGINGLSIFGILAVILSRKEVGHKRLIRFGMGLFGLQGLTALSIGADLYFNTFTLRTACIREVFSLSGTACVVFLGISIRDIWKTLIASERATQSEKKLVAYADEEQQQKIIFIDELSKSTNERMRQAVAGGR